jgi:hypothetical protein
VAEQRTLGCALAGKSNQPPFSRWMPSIFCVFHLPGAQGLIEAVIFLQEVAVMICPYCDVEYTPEPPCFCQPKSMAAYPEKFILAPPEKQKGIEHPPTGLNNPFWN